MTMYISTMCVCGDNQLIQDLGADNQFIPHVNRRTGELCPGVPKTPMISESDSAEIKRLQAEIDVMRQALSDALVTEGKLRSVCKQLNATCERRGKERDDMNPVFMAAIRWAKVNEEQPKPRALSEEHHAHEMRWDAALDEIAEAVKTFYAKLKEKNQ